MFTTNARGNVLIYSLLIMVSLAAILLPLSVVITRSFVRSELLSDSLQAWYVAESGIENSLYKMRQTDWETRFTDFPDIGTQGLLFGGRVEGQVITAGTTTRITVPSQQSWQLDLFTPDLFDTDIIRSLRLQVPDGSTVEPGWLLVRWVPWDPTEGYDTSAAQEKLIALADITEGSSAVVSLVDSGTDPFAYQITFRALQSGAVPLDITAYSSLDGGGAAVALPLVTGIESRGYYGKASQLIGVAALGRSPLYGLFEYVIFSDQSIVK